MALAHFLMLVAVCIAAARAQSTSTDSSGTNGSVGISPSAPESAGNGSSSRLPVNRTLTADEVSRATRSPTLGGRHLRIVPQGGHVVLCSDDSCSNYIVWTPCRARIYKGASLDEHELYTGTTLPLYHTKYCQYLFLHRKFIPSSALLKGRYGYQSLTVVPYTYM